jgi:PPK2 family polyphosphate:nucleotide phosphotransferase
MLPSEILERYRVRKGANFRITDIDPADTCGIDIEKAEAKALLAEGVKRLSALQERLYADHTYAILIILQALDAAGKDSVIKHVISGVNPQGCEVHPFKVPSQLELDHDFLWRASLALPRRGHIDIFNRSYYEEVLVVRVHKELLERQRISPSLVTKNIWNERFADINAFEHYLTRNGVIIRKFFLNLSREEQKKRFMSRLDDPNKNWKYSTTDVTERERWDEYMAAYEDMIQHTATPHSPWYVVPADNKWYTRLVVAAAIADALEELKLAYPTVDAAKRKELKAARAALEREGRG